MCRMASSKLLLPCWLCVLVAVLSSCAAAAGRSSSSALALAARCRSCRRSERRQATTFFARRRRRVVNNKDRDAAVLLCSRGLFRCLPSHAFLRPSSGGDGCCLWRRRRCCCCSGIYASAPSPHRCALPRLLHGRQQHRRFPLRHPASQMPLCRYPRPRSRQRCRPAGRRPRPGGCCGAQRLLRAPSAPRRSRQDVPCAAGVERSPVRAGLRAPLRRPRQPHPDVLPVRLPVQRLPASGRRMAAGQLRGRQRRRCRRFQYYINPGGVPTKPPRSCLCSQGGCGECTPPPPAAPKYARSLLTTAHVKAS